MSLSLLSIVVPSLMPARPGFLVETPFGDICSRLYEEAETRVRTHSGRARRWNRLHYLLGLVTVVLAAASGVGGVSEILPGHTANWLALLAATTGAASTFLATDAQRKAQQA